MVLCRAHSALVSLARSSSFVASRITPCRPNKRVVVCFVEFLVVAHRVCSLNLDPPLSFLT